MTFWLVMLGGVVRGQYAVVSISRFRRRHLHALAGLADDAPDNNLRQTCIDVLCAYLRLRYSPDPGEGPAHLEEHHHYLALREVRHTILRLIGDHYRRPQGTHGSWQGCDLDLTGVTIDGDMDFRGAVFSGGTVHFYEAVFSGGEVSFDGAEFSGGTVSFIGAEFSGGEVSFDGAEFSGGTVSIRRAVFSGGEVSFVSAVFSGGEVPFYEAVFSGGTVDFVSAEFSDGTVDFDEAVFSGGTVDFVSATGQAPRGLLAAVGTPALAGVALPPSWLPFVP
ncbi:pentapeptide repeat-containing protein [Streptomyces atratus]|uniref:pentapeptide repeat-containing protein n=1 Tax=Streptomyces atratus TaxID=1893 RepID=UPI0036613C0D